MTQENAPLSPDVSSRARAPRPGQAGWLILAGAAGFALPVLACYGLIFTLAVAGRVLSFGSASPDGFAASSGRGPAVAVIRVEGIIASGEIDPLGQGLAASQAIIEKLEAAQASDDVKAIVLMVNSPGGGVNASDTIYHALKGIDKPVVVMMGDLAASGGYYISMAADWIVASPHTLTGSIGVISEFPNAEELLKKVGVEVVVIVSGPRKDLGSLYREMTEDERAYWQAIVDETHAAFVAVVAEGRGLPLEQVEALADGSVYTGRQALELGLVDQVGYAEDAIAKAAEMGGIEGEPRILEFEDRPTLLELLTAASARTSLVPTWAEILSLIGHPALSARWIGP